MNLHEYGYRGECHCSGIVCGRSDRSRWAVPSRCGSRCYSRSFLFGIQYAGGSGKQSFADNDRFAGKRCGFARSRGDRLWNCPQERCHRVGYFGETLGFTAVESDYYTRCLPDQQILCRSRQTCIYLIGFHQSNRPCGIALLEQSGSIVYEFNHQKYLI